MLNVHSDGASGAGGDVIAKWLYYMICNFNSKHVCRSESLRLHLHFVVFHSCSERDSVHHEVSNCVQDGPHHSTGCQANIQPHLTSLNHEAVKLQPPVHELHIRQDVSGTYNNIASKHSANIKITIATPRHGKKCPENGKHGHCNTTGFGDHIAAPCNPISGVPSLRNPRPEEIEDYPLRQAQCHHPPPHRTRKWRPHSRNDRHARPRRLRTESSASSSLR